MITNNRNMEQKYPEERVIFMPMEEIRCIERVLDSLELIRYTFQRIADEMKIIEN